MPLLPRPELGEWDGVWHSCSPYTDLRKMLRDIQEGVKETGEPVLVVTDPHRRTIGFCMTQLGTENEKVVERQWLWEMEAAVFRDNLWRSPELRKVFDFPVKATNLAQVAKRLSDGETFI